MRDDAFEHEILQDFKDLVMKLALEMPGRLRQMQTAAEYKEGVDTLFRMVHSLKPVAAYLHFDAPLKLIETCETVLNVLRTRSEPRRNDATMSWLQRVAEQFENWNDDLLIGARLGPVDPEIMQLLKIGRRRRHPKELLAPLNLLVVSGDRAFREAVAKGISPHVRTLHAASHFREAEALYFEHYPDIVLCDFALDGGHTALELHKHINLEGEPLPFLVMLGSTQRKAFRKLALYGLQTLIKPFSLKHLLYELIETARFYFGQQRVRIDSGNLLQQIEAIRPLPDSLQKVIALCNSEESDLKEIVYAVKNDPILAALVMKEANSPLYGQKAQSVERAVSFFGKRVVKALALCQSSALLEPLDLTCYGMTAERFKTVSNLRLALMMAWYSKVDVRALGILASAAAISNLGQIIVARELQAMNACGALHALLKDHSLCEAEERLLGTTTPEVTADILKHWHFDRSTVDAVRYAYAPEYAPEESRLAAVANHAVHRLVPLGADTLPVTVPESLAELLRREGLDPELLQQALTRLGGA